MSETPAVSLPDRPVLLDGGMGRELRVPEGWTLDSGPRTGEQLRHRDDLVPDEYAVFVADWLKNGARIVGGCCGIGPAHIARLHEMILDDCPKSEVLA